MSDEYSTVLVTGATSFIGAHVIKTLLDRNYTVRGTVRDPSSPKVAPVIEMDPSGHRLTIVKADLNDIHCFPRIVEGCQAVIHVATPVIFPADDSFPYKDEQDAMDRQIRPAVEATTQLMQIAADKGVRKFVLTSSQVAMYATPEPPDVMSEACWSNVDYLRKILPERGAAAYMLAKTLQERDAWELSKNIDIKLVVICPAHVLGPSYFDLVHPSREYVLKIAKGGGAYGDFCTSDKIPDSYVALVDVRDTALAHVLAMETDCAEGRYLVASYPVHCEDLLRVARRVAGCEKIPDMEVDQKQPRAQMKFDSSRFMDLIGEVIPWEQTVEDMIHDFLKKNLL